MLICPVIQAATARRPPTASPSSCRYFLADVPIQGRNPRIKLFRYAPNDTPNVVPARTRTHSPRRLHKHKHTPRHLHNHVHIRAHITTSGCSLVTKLAYNTNDWIDRCLIESIGAATSNMHVAPWPRTHARPSLSAKARAKSFGTLDFTIAFATMSNIALVCLVCRVCFVCSACVLRLRANSFPFGLT